MYDRLTVNGFPGRKPLVKTPQAGRPRFWYQERRIVIGRRWDRRDRQR
ncbi:MAG: hypothetical protein K1W10_11120 [Lachnospiraceae bacterium]